MNVRIYMHFIIKYVVHHTLTTLTYTYVRNTIESVDPISRDDPDTPYIDAIYIYITNAGISRTR